MLLTPADLMGIGFDTSTLPTEDVAAICDRASAMVVIEAGRPFEVGNKSEHLPVYNVGGIIKLFPTILPVRAVPLVRVRMGVSDVRELHDLEINNDGGYVWAYSDIGSMGRNVVAEVDYTHGYDTIPHEVKEAAILTAKALLGDYMATKMTNMNGVTSVKDGQRQVNANNVVEVPPAAKALLADFKVVR